MNKGSEQKRIESFEDLKVWQEGHKLVLAVYRETSKFPKAEQFGLTSQVRRAVVSVTSNIAEGFARRSMKEKGQFYYLAKGSLTEVKNQLRIAHDVGFLEKGAFQVMSRLANNTDQLLQGLIRATHMRSKK